MQFQKYIKAVGTGPKSNRELTRNEVIDAINKILKKEVLPERITAFLLGWRVRLETNEELKAALFACDGFITKQNIPDSIELGYAYDGKNKTPYLFPLVAKYLKPYDLHIVVSGDLLQPAKKGLTVKELCENIKLEDNVHYFDRANYFKELSQLTELRNILGLRTAFNTIEKLLNPASSSFAVTAAFHKPYVSKYHEIFGSRYKNLTVLKGAEGAPEFFTRCKYWVKKEDDYEEIIIDPAQYGISYDKEWEKITLKECKKELSKPSEDLENLAKLNAAFLLVVAQKATDVNAAFEMITAQS
jgi:anthranilate phosphoribosyltransferase